MNFDVSTLRVGVSKENGLYQEDMACLAIMKLLNLNCWTASLNPPSSSLLTVSFPGIPLTGFDTGPKDRLMRGA